jgi:DNA repair protein RadC
MESVIETAVENKNPEAMTLKTVREVVVNYRGRRRPSVLIDSATVVAHHIRKALPDNSREHIVALYLDAGHKLIGFAVTSTGTANMCQVHPREIFQRAVLLGAVAIVIGHNHPSGQPNPSQEDDKVTQAIKEGGTLLGIKLLDHVIVTQSRHFSFTETGRL